MSKIKVYLITDSDAIDLLVNDNLDAFKAYVSSDWIDIDEPLEFDTKAEVLAFCMGLGYGKDERTFPDIYPLRSCEPYDQPYIEAIESVD